MASLSISYRLKSDKTITAYQMMGYSRDGHDVQFCNSFSYCLLQV